jgi:hypothetical protein
LLDQASVQFETGLQCSDTGINEHSPILGTKPMMMMLEVATNVMVGIPLLGIDNRRTRHSKSGYRNHYSLQHVIFPQMV